MNRHRGRALGAAVLLAIIACATAPAARAVAAPAGDEKVVNINTASLEDLMTLPGIGKAYAERIVEYRQKNGPFKKVEDLLNVRGIGEKTFEKIRPRLTIGKG
jgi:competence protein ComEA